MTREDAPFSLKLHLIYLMNDVLHHSVRKGADELKQSLESVAVEMFCGAASGASEEQRAKLTKLIRLWDEKRIFSATTLAKMRASEESWIAYKEQLKEDYAGIIAEATAQHQQTYDNYQRQHQQFVQHATSSIQQLEANKIRVQEQIGAAEASAASAVQAAAVTKEQQQPAPPQPIPLSTSPWGSVPPSLQQQQQQQPQPQLQTPQVSAVAEATSNGSEESNTTGGRQQRTARSSRWDTTGASSTSGPPPTQPPPGVAMDPQVWTPPSEGALPPPQGLPDMSRPPPGFPPMDEKALIPTLPYYELPAALMVPLVKLEDSGYKPLDPSSIRLPPPTPPTERLLQALDLFYAPPSHDRPRDPEGWEVIGLYEWFRDKSEAVASKAAAIERGERERSPTASPEPFSNPPTPDRTPPPQSSEKKTVKSQQKDLKKKRRYYAEEKPDNEREVDEPPPPHRRRSRSRSRSSSPGRPARHSRRRSPSRSPSPPSFAGFGTNVTEKLDASNKGHQMMQKMGWRGMGLGSDGSGIVEPISGGEVRDKSDQYKGVGIGTDPFERFRKAKSGSFHIRMKERGDPRP